MSVVVKLSKLEENMIDTCSFDHLFPIEVYLCLCPERSIATLVKEVGDINNVNMH